ncbi:MAG: hypothetical protein KAU17_06125 [Spirochaetales bacterium]|nr:hypothetical protein [Spirochaetales bacterium]
MRVPSVLLLLIMCVVLIVPVAADDVETKDTESEPSEPVPYEKEEFPPWLRDLRRGEVIFFGSYPITLFVSSLAYDGFRLIQNSLILKEENYSLMTDPLTVDEKKYILLSAAGVSLVIALIDFLLGLGETSQ